MLANEILIYPHYLENFIKSMGGGRARTPTKTLTVLAAAAKSLQSCPTLCDPIDGSPPGSFHRKCLFLPGGRRTKEMWARFIPTAGM